MNLGHITDSVKTSWLMYPLRLLAAIIRLPKLILRINATNQRLESEIAQTNRRLEAEIAGTNQRVDDLATNPQLAFSFVRKAEPFITRSENRHGHAVSSLSFGEKEKRFYSYFGEIWGEGYELIHRKQYEVYLQYIVRGHNEPFLDIGSGAGEFVGFLEENGIRALGIDSDACEVERGKARGLNVIHAEALDFLNATESQYAGISLIEVVEHIALDRVNKMIQSAFAKIESNGILLIETINIKHPLALHGFYTDPTHVRPISDDCISFLMQWNGFRDVQIVYTNPIWLPGTSRYDLTRIYYNYAVVGRRV